ncbi:MAG: DUF4168 domain-containing protein [Cyclobacteriaceae bacterium]
MINRKNLKPFTTIFSLLLFVSLTSQSVFAQALPGAPAAPQENIKTDFSDKDLMEFIECNKKLAVIQQESQVNMINAIESESLTVERYNEIMQVKQGNAEGVDEPSSTENEAFDKATEVVMVEQQKMSQVIEETVEKEMGVEKFQNIYLAYQQDPNVKEKIESLMQP